MSIDNKRTHINSFTAYQQKSLKIARITVVVSALVFIIGIIMITYATLIIQQPCNLK